MPVTLPAAVDALTNGQTLDADWTNSVQALVNALRTRTLDYEPILVAKTLDETVNNTATLQADNELFLPVAANATYQVEAQFLFLSNATADWKMGWSFPTGLTMSYSTLGFNASDVFGNTHVDQTTVPGYNGGGHGAIGGYDTVQLLGTVKVSSTAGNLALQWAQNTATVTNTTVKADSFMSLTRIS